MSRRGLWAVGGALVVALLGGACTSEDASEGDKCTPGDRQPCTCDSGADGTQTCNAEGSGFSLCDCGGGTGGTSGTGGGGTGGGGTGGGGTGGGGTGGAVGDAGGTDGGLTDASMGGSDASTGGTGTDASTGGTGGSPTDGGCGAVPDAGDVCVNCVAQNCCAELDACSAPGNTCLTPTGGDAAVAFSDYECVDYCIYLSAQDGGAANLAVANDCVTSCGANNETRSLFQCIFGQGGGTDCISECY